MVEHPWPGLAAELIVRVGQLEFLADQSFGECVPLAAGEHWLQSRAWCVLPVNRRYTPLPKLYSSTVDTAPTYRVQLSKIVRRTQPDAFPVSIAASPVFHDTLSCFIKQKRKKTPTFAECFVKFLH